jgi:hypothetical protein
MSRNPIMMTTDQMTNHGRISSAFVFGHSFVIRHSCFVIFSALFLMLITHSDSDASPQPQYPNMIGKWNIEISFGDGTKRSLQFEAQDEGKGTLELVDQKAKVWGMSSSWPAKWAPGDGNSVTFSGPAEFPLGNVGRDAGTLLFKGKFEGADSITGEVEFAPLVGDRPTKHGTFKATRAQ